MKFIYKILSLILVWIMLFTANIPMGTAAGAGTTDDVQSDTIGFLCKIGILDGGNSSWTQKITRAELVDAIMKTLGYENKYLNENAKTDLTQNIYFTDVAQDNKYDSNIKNAVILGVASGYENNTFRPDGEVTYLEAVKFMISALGYGEYAEASGGYPVGYMAAAASLKLKLSAVNADDSITRSQAADLIYDMLDAETVAVSKVRVNDDGHVLAEDGTLLENIFKIKKITGVIETVDNVSINGIVPDDTKGIFINGINYKYEIDNCIDYLGLDVTAFVKFDDVNTDGMTEFIMSSEKNNLLDLSSEDIDSITEDKLNYVDKDEKTHDISLEKDIKAVINGTHCYPFDPQLVLDTEKLGTVKLIDNDNDGAYNVIIANMYNDMSVGRVNVIKNVITDDYSYILTMPEDKETVRYIPDDYKTLNMVIKKSGKEITMKDIKSKDIISYAATTYGETANVTILVCSDQVTGIVTEMGNDDITVNGEKYDFSPYYKWLNQIDTSNPKILSTPQINDTITLRLDAFGKVAAIDIETKDGGKAYILDYDDAPNSLSGLQIKVLDSNGLIEIYSLNSTLVFNGDKKSGDAIKQALKAEMLKFNQYINSVKTKTDGTKDADQWDNFEMYPNAAKGPQQLPISYEFNNNGKIRKIDVLNYIKPVQFSYKSRTISATLANGDGEIYKLTTEASILGIGIDNHGNIEDEQTGGLEDKNLSARNVQRWDDWSNAILCDVDANNKVGMLVYDSFDENGKGYEYACFSLLDSYTKNFMAVNRVATGINDSGDRTIIIEGITGGAVKKFTLAGKVYYRMFTEKDQGYPSKQMRVWGDKPPFGRSETDFSNPEKAPIQPGDVITYNTNMYGEISAVTWFISARHYPTQVYNMRNIVADMQWGALYGYVNYADEASLQIDNSYETGSLGSRPMNKPDGTLLDFSKNNVIYWNKDKQKWMMGKRENIYESYKRMNVPEHYVLDDDSHDDYTAKGDYDNCWALANISNWNVTEVYFIDFD